MRDWIWQSVRQHSHDRVFGYIYFSLMLIGLLIGGTWNITVGGILIGTATAFGLTLARVEGYKPRRVFTVSCIFALLYLFNLFIDAWMTGSAVWMRAIVGFFQVPSVLFAWIGSVIWLAQPESAMRPTGLGNTDYDPRMRKP